jgi:uncharacterized SAM-binding protein YcdF (DUF218 family)
MSVLLEYFQGKYEVTFLVALTIMSLIFFLSVYFYDRRKLLVGFSFNLFLFFALLLIAFLGVTSNNTFLEGIVIGLSIIMAFLLIFGVYILVIGLIINTKIVMKKERKSLSNMLTLILAIALIVYIIIDILNIDKFLSPNIRLLFNSLYLVAFYLLIDVINFLTSMFLYQFNKPKLNQDFVIVLGSGLIGDKVPPLLASRIDKAIEFYKKQSKVSTPPKIIFSGGQGPDEDISEALGMQRYAISKGIDPKHTILEDKSTTTLENMKFSKVIMENMNSNSYNSIFVTNNYHLFRAGIYARLSGLKSNGIGSKTAKYFMPNAIIREYIAIISMHKKRYILVFALIILFSVILMILPSLALIYIKFMQ